MLEKLIKKIVSTAIDSLDKMGCMINEVPKKVKRGNNFATSPLITLKRKLSKLPKIQTGAKGSPKAKGTKSSETRIFNHPRR